MCKFMVNNVELFEKEIDDMFDDDINETSDKYDTGKIRH